MNLVARLLGGVLPVLMLLGGAANLGAQESLFKLNDGTLDVSVTHPLPKSISRGMSAMFVDLKNDGAVTRDVELVYKPNGSRRRFEIRSQVQVPAGVKLRHEMLLPAFVDLYGGEFWVYSGGDSEHDNSLSMHTGENPGGVQPVLVLGDGLANASETASWAEGMAQGEIKRGSTTEPDLQLSYVGPGDLPRRFESYSGLSAMVVDTRFPVTPSSMEPALRWLRLGGTLIFSGPGADRFAAEMPGLELWMQERFRYVNAYQVADSPGVDIFHCGLGQLVIAESIDFLAPSQLEGMQMAIYANQGFVPAPTSSPASYYYASPVRISGSTAAAGSYVKPLPLVGVGDLPYRLFIMLLIAFFVIVAPMNFRLVKRTGKPGWLLLTIPALACFASTSFLAYGIFYQGLGLSQASQSLTVLDQREHRSQTAELRSFFAGMAPRDGLSPGAGSLVLPVLENYWRAPATYHRIDMGSSLALKGDYLPVRTESTQVVLADRAARGRLQIERLEDQFAVTNGLGAPIRRLALRAPGGQLHVFEGAVGVRIQDGAKGALEAADGAEPQLVDWLPTPREGRDLGWAEDLPEGMYLAVLDQNPFADSTGLEPEDAVGQHVLFGVLSMDAEDWQ